MFWINNPSSGPYTRQIAGII